MTEMGNTTGNSQSNNDQGEDEDDQQRRNRGGRSNVLYHVFVNRGSNSSEIRREEVNVSSGQTVQDQHDKPEDDMPLEEEPEEELVDSDSEELDDVDYFTEEDERTITLQFLSQLLGVGQNVRQR